MWEEPQALLEKWGELTDMPDFLEKPQGDGVTEEVVKRMEAEIKERLNRELEADTYYVSRVSIRFTEEQGEETGTLLPELIVWMKERAGEEEGDGQIGIEEIVIGQPAESAADETFSSYRARFAVLLGMEEERVEVRQDGRG